MNHYIQIVQDGLDSSEANWKKLRILFAQDTVYPYGTVQGETNERTIAGKLSQQLGPSYIYLKGTLKIQHIEEEGYATIDDTRTWMTSIDPAKRRLLVRLFDYVGGNCTGVIQYQTLDVSGLSFPLTSKLSVFPSGETSFSIATVLSPTSATLNVSADYFYSGPMRVGMPIHKVSFVGGTHEPMAQVPYIESIGGFYYQPFQLEQRG